MATQILVVEDEAAIRDMLCFTLQTAGYEVLQAANAEEAWRILQREAPDLVLLDWMLPGTSGIQLLQRLRHNGALAGMPVIMLTAKGAEQDQVEGFDAGADDYVVKPFSPKALVARIQAVLRRIEGHGGQQEQLQSGLLRVDLAAHRVLCCGEQVHLGPTEFKLLSFLMSHPERVFSRAQLLDQVWGEHVVVEERTVDVHIRRLRKALEAGGCADCVETVRGVGYRFSGSHA